MTFKEALRRGSEILSQHYIEEAALDAWYLLEFVTGISRAWYYARQEKELTETQEKLYFKYIGERKNRTPLQHITKVQEFMGLSFEVNEHVLIPRQDTEVLVETVQDFLKPRMQVLDMCTGSGCIIISLAYENEITCSAVDISREAIKVAEINSERNGVEVSFVQSDLFTEVKGAFDVIVSNPPYIRTADIEDLQVEVKLHDPLIALDGKSDGLFFYRKIIKESRKHLTEHGHLFFEIGYDQGTVVAALMKDAGFTGITVKKDLTGLDRVVFGVYNRAEKWEELTCLTD